MKRLNKSGNDSKTEDVKRKLSKADINGIFSDLTISILPTGIGNSRCKLFTTQVKNNGGKMVSPSDENATHLIIDDSLTWEKVCTILNWKHASPSPALKVIKSVWLSMCLNKKILIPTADFEVLQMLEPQITPPVSNIRNSFSREVLSMPSSDIITNRSSEEDKHSFNSPVSSISHQELGKWACSFPSSSKKANLNKNITDKLEQLAETYQNTKDQWRAFSYQKAINTLKSWPKSIDSLEEARNVPGVGSRLAEKIWEIIESGSLRKLEVAASDGEVRALNLFAQVWGAGPSTSQSWVQLGFRTLEDLKASGKLTRQQLIGLKHFNDFLDKMPWEEASQIVNKVKEAALNFNPDLEVVGCGSFRRGKSLCGDVDILISHLNGPQEGILDPILHQLTQCGFLTDHLINPEPGAAHQTYMGVCRLDGPDQKYRRLDLFVVPREEFAPALLAYTGSGHFNRSMRLLARKKGMALSHKSLRTGVIRKGAEKIFDGVSLSTPTEESIFQHLGLEYRTPEERDH